MQRKKDFPKGGQATKQLQRQIQKQIPFGDDKQETTARANTTATANTGILRCAQDDDVKTTTTTTTKI
jgi:hypothetical protein